MTKPIAERFLEHFSKIDNVTHYEGAVIDWLQEQPENKQPLFTLEEVEQIAREAFWENDGVRKVFDQWWELKKKQLLEKQGK
jgi:hypothetical protein